MVSYLDILFLPLKASDWCRVHSREDGKVRVEVIKFPQELKTQVHWLYNK